ncbi:MAG: bifunctional 2-C-methyl-D-erythritol 4-phosphate cytidylyltransferase/2-C-methyl-D-erythritol 2,4-cyclodiphosphate synthase [Cucumibacter sp.]
MSLTVAAIVVAAGTGERVRAAGEVPKQYRALAGKPMLVRAIEALLEVPAVNHLIAVINADQLPLYSDLGLKDARVLAPAIGGASRQASVLAGLAALEELAPDLVLIHDAARPFADAGLIGRVIAAAAEAGAAAPVLPVSDTIKLSPDGATVEATLDRKTLYAAQTPQGFRYPEILSAHRQAAAAGGTSFTDDAGIAEWAGMQVRLVEGDARNVKLTYPADFAAAERRIMGEARMETRVGTGYDVHAFEPGDHVMLGGLRIAHSHGLKGHSDADVALHALTDALFGALAEGDLGRHFSPADPQWKGTDSASFLDHAAKRVAARGGRILHLDLTIVCEAPKIAPHAEAMQARIAAIAGISAGRVSVKATTSEGLGFTGRREGIAASATATVELPADA